MPFVKKQVLKVTAIAAALCVVPALASAQEVDVDEVEVELEEPGESGFIFGVDVGVGQLVCNTADCAGLTGAGAVGGYLGYMLTDRVALVGEVQGVGHAAERLVVTQGIATVGPQIWLSDRFWVRAGGGLAYTAFAYDEDEFDVEDIEDPEDIESRSRRLPAAAAAVGVEMVGRETYAVDAQLRLGSTFMVDDTRNQVRSIVLGVGLHWY